MHTQIGSAGKKYIYEERAAESEGVHDEEGGEESGSPANTS